MPLGEDQAASAGGERARQVAIIGHNLAQPRKIGESGVGRKSQDGEYGGDRSVVENAPSGHGADELREQAVVAGLARIGGADMVYPRQPGDRPPASG